MSVEIEDGVRVIEVERADGGYTPGMSRHIEDPWAKAEVSEQILKPPYDPQELLEILDKSEVLRPCIEAMATNVDGFGFQLDPTFQLGEGAETPAEAVMEKKRVERFFEFINPELSFIELRKRTRFDMETIGYAFWEILRNGKGEVAGAVHIPAQTMRLCKLDEQPQEVELRVWEPEANDWLTMRYYKRFRRFAQVVGQKIVYFKEFGDLRRMNANTGKYEGEREGEVPTAEGWKEATEILYWPMYHPGTPYGVPRWIGLLLAIAGSRAAAEVNWSYFDSKAIPPLIISVSGGRLSDRAVKRIQRYLEELKGRENYHKVLVIEAETGAETNPLGPQADNKTKVEVKDLGGALLKDGVFMEYDRDNRKKVLSAFRLPPLYVGASEDYNKATSEEAHSVAEQQVFGPERHAFDWVINRRLLPALGVRYWQFRSNSSVQDEIGSMSEIVERLSKVGLTMREARKLVDHVLNIDLDGVQEAEWLDYPLAIYLEMLRAGITQQQLERNPQGDNTDPQESPAAGEQVPDAVAKAVAGLVQLRKMVEAAIHADGQEVGAA